MVDEHGKSRGAQASGWRSSSPPAILFGIILPFVLSACGVYRGLPSHGGGKRFDEEERAVSAAVRTAVNEMDLAALSGLKVRLQIESLAHSGGGSVTWPGPENLYPNWSVSPNSSSGCYDSFRPYDPSFANAPAPLPSANVGGFWYPASRSGSQGASSSRSTSLGWRFAPGFSSFAYGSDADLNYLAASLRMRLLHEGIKVTDDGAEAVLVVLVDVLGTNLSRADALVWLRDNLAASCELTYFALRPNTQELIFKARRAGGEARYRETGLILCSGLFHSRSVDSLCSAELAEIPLPGHSGGNTIIAGAAASGNAEKASSPPARLQVASRDRLAVPPAKVARSRSAQEPPGLIIKEQERQ